MPEIDFRCIAVESNALLRPYLLNLPNAPTDAWDVFVVHMFRLADLTAADADKIRTMPVAIHFATAAGPIDLDEELTEQDAARVKTRLDWILNEGQVIRHALPAAMLQSADPRFLGPVFTVAPYVDDILTNGEIDPADHDSLAVFRAVALARRKAPDSGPIPVLAEDHAWRDWQREQASRVIPTLPLFAYDAHAEPGMQP